MRQWWKNIDTKAREKHPELWKIVMWMIVGFIANVPELAVYMACLKGFRAMEVASLGIFGFMTSVVPPKEGYTIATVVYAYMISTAVGYTIAFILNRKATFQANANIALSTFLYVLMVILIIITNGIMGPNISALVAHLHLPENVAEPISKFLCMIAAGLWSYPITRFVIHRKKKEAADEPSEQCA